jgi:hypothetical protein
MVFFGLVECNTLASWAHSLVTKKTKCCEYGPRMPKNDASNRGLHIISIAT